MFEDGQTEHLPMPLYYLHIKDGAELLRSFQVREIGPLSAASGTNVEWVETIGAGLLGVKRNPPTLLARVVFRRPLVESECGAVALG